MADGGNGASGDGSDSGGGGFWSSAGGASAIGAGTQVAGGLLNAAVFAPRKNRANARQAAQMDPFLDVMENISLADVRGAGQAVQGLSGQIAGLAPQFQQVGQQTASGIRMGTREAQGAARRAAGDVRMASGRAASDLRGMARDIRTSDVTGLEAAARRRLEGQGSALQAQLAARGLASSGVGGQAQRNLLSEGLTSLASQINEDQFRRSQAAGGFLGQAGQFDVQGATQAGQFGVQAGQLGMQGAAQAGNALQAGLAGSQGALQAGMQGQQAAANIFQNATQAEQNAAVNAAQLIASTPGFKNYDRATGKTRGK